MDAPVVICSGRIAPAVCEEFPDLRISWCSVPVRPGPSPPVLRRRLAALADGYRGAGVVAMRTHVVPQAYRAFFRLIGLDPDQDRIPSEQVALRRLLEGGFRSRDLVSDALLIALVETGVPVWALDSARLTGPLEIRTTQPGETIEPADGQPVRRLGAGWLVVADQQGPCGVLFREISPARAVNQRTEEATLFAVAVPGVPQIHLEEALWIATESLRID